MASNQIDQARIKLSGADRDYVTAMNREASGFALAGGVVTSFLPN